MKIFGREPAVILGFVSALVSLLGYQFGVSAEVQTAVNTLAAAIVAVVIAAVVNTGALGASIMSLAQAVFALFAGLGLDWSADKQAFYLGALSALLGLFQRTQVQAPVSAVPMEQKSALSKGAHAA